MIIKSKQAGDFTTLPNHIFRINLSIEAIGLLSYLLHLPDSWILYKCNLHDKLAMGREKLDRVFKELQGKGFIISRKKQSENGKIEYEHTVYDKPFNGEPSTVKPSTANPPLVNTNNSKETRVKNIVAEATSEDLFESFRKLYPGTKRGNDTELNTFKKHKDWLKILPTLLGAVQAQISKREEDRKAGKFVPEWKNLKTWINQRCWEEVIQSESSKEVVGWVIVYNPSAMESGYKGPKVLGRRPVYQGDKIPNGMKALTNPEALSYPIYNPKRSQNEL
jgi:hypothetical protein